MSLNSKYSNWILLLLVSFIWGSPYILREIALESFSHNQVAAFQVFLSFLFFLPLIFKNFKKLSKDNWLPLLLTGISGNIGPSYFFAKAQTQINSSIAGMLNAMLPMITLLLAILFFKSKTNKKVFGGILLGFAGTLVLSFTGESHGASYFWGVFYVFMAILSIAISINIVSFSLPKLNGTEIASLAFLFVGPMAACFLLFTDLSAPLASDAWLASYFNFWRCNLLQSTHQKILTCIRRFHSLYYTNCSHLLGNCNWWRSGFNCTNCINIDYLSWSTYNTPIK